ncbi:MAG: CAP domain-containing protein [Synechococcales cyanobacterium C42_A2020_086]|nr:CAP domain-containing protein [Synechococcales cyanobacterium C42_A2020_086]
MVRWSTAKLRLRWLLGIPLLWAIAGCEAVDQLVNRLPPLPVAIQQDAPSPTPAQSDSIAEMELQVRQQINQIRQEQGLRPLENNEELAQVARNYSRRMAEQDFFSHTGPDGDTPAERVQSAGIFYFMVGENLFTGTNIPQPVPAAVEGWMNSQGHRENILRPEYRETGIGIWRRDNTYYFTQLFMRAL